MFGLLYISGHQCLISTGARLNLRRAYRRTFE
jgi:hypothetical protein